MGAYRKTCHHREQSIFLVFLSFFSSTTSTAMERRHTARTSRFGPSGDANENNSTNANNDADQGNAKGETRNQSANKQIRDEDALRARYHAVYPVPLHSYGIFYKRNEAIIGSGSPKLSNECRQKNSTKPTKKKLSVVQEEREE